MKTRSDYRLDKEFNCPIDGQKLEIVRPYGIGSGYFCQGCGATYSGRTTDQDSFNKQAAAYAKSKKEELVKERKHIDRLETIVALAEGKGLIKKN